jgi:hypothetical protein
MHVVAQLASISRPSPIGAKLIVGSRSPARPRDAAPCEASTSNDPALIKMLREIVQDVTTVIVAGRSSQVSRTAEGVWHVPVAALRGAVLAAQEQDKLKIIGSEEGAAFGRAADRLRSAPDDAPHDADLILAVALSLSGAFKEGIAGQPAAPLAPPEARAKPGADP